MSITYQDIREFSPQDLKDLFLSVEWSSGHYPDKLATAMKNYGSVYSAWDKDQLVGLVSTMDDGVMNAYVHYLLVDPKYQGQGIAGELMRMTREYYKDYLRIVLIATSIGKGFYERCGFTECGHGKMAMEVTSLWT